VELANAAKKGGKGEHSGDKSKKNGRRRREEKRFVKKRKWAIALSQSHPRLKKGRKEGGQEGARGLVPSASGTGPDRPLREKTNTTKEFGKMVNDGGYCKYKRSNCDVD